MWIHSTGGKRRAADAGGIVPRASAAFHPLVTSSVQIIAEPLKRVCDEKVSQCELDDI